MGIITWLFGTKLGRTVLLLGTIAITVVITYNVVEQKGYDRCKREWDASIADANVKVIDEQNERDAKSSDITQDARASNQTNTQAIDKQAAKSEEVVNDVYDKPPRTKPVTYGSCVHPVDDRVQDEIERGYRQANPAAR